MALRVVFFGNSESAFSNRHFQALWKAPCQVAGVVDVPPAKRTSTNTRPPGDLPNFVGLARQEGIVAYEPASPNLPEFVQAMRELEPDLFIAVGYMNRLKEAILSVPRILVANFHASLLPAYRGKHPVFWALRNGERWSGLTVHVMDAGLDTGDILYQVRVRTRKRDTVASLYDRIMERSLELVPRLVRDAAQGKLRRQPQTGLGASYYSSVSPEDFRLDWARDAEQLRRWIQTSPGQCFCEVTGQHIFFMDADLIPISQQRSKGARGQGSRGAEETFTPASLLLRTPTPSPLPGVLLRIGRTTCTVAAGQDALRMRQVRLGQAGEKAMAQLCRELGLQVGNSLS